MLISLTAPSGGGKEFLKKALLQRFPGLKELCWTTTRLLRHRGEIQGVTRESVSHTEFDALEKAGELAFVQSLVGGRYGIRRGFLERTSGHFLTEFHIDNLIATSRAGHSPVAIALIPRDIAFLEERLARRGTESPAEIAERLKSARIEIDKIRENRGLFILIVEFAKDDEHTVVNRVVECLEQCIENNRP